MRSNKDLFMQTRESSQSFSDYVNYLREINERRYKAKKPAKAKAQDTNEGVLAPF